MTYTTIERARIQLLLTQPFFATLIYQTDFVSDTSVPYAATDGRRILINEGALNALPIEEVKTILAHEIAHIIWLHIPRKGARELRPWNYATDYVINLMLVECKFAPVEGWLYDLQYAGLSAEQVYDLLPILPPEEEPQGGEDDGDEAGDGEGAGPGQQPGAKPAKGSTKGRGTQGDLRPDLGPPMTVDQVAQQEQRMRNQVAGAAMMARMQGKMPAGLERAIGELLDPQVPWYVVLRDYMQRTTQDDESWSRRNRRLSQVYLPAKHSEKMGEITVIIDTSGSIQQQEIDQAMSEVAAIAEQVDPERIRIVWADAKVAGEQLFESGDVLTPEPAGGGGTDMRIPLTHIEQYAPHIAILITDGYTPWPPIEPPFPLIVCCTTDTAVPIGAVIRMR